MAKVQWRDDGSLLVAAEQIEHLRRQCAGEPRLLKIDDSVLLCAHRQPGQRQHPLLYGDLRLFSVAELLALLASLRASGRLQLLVPHARKSIVFAEGQVIHAASTVEDDRLGEVLWRRGVLTLKQLSQVHDLVGPGRKLGAVLREKGIIDARQLYEGIKAQVEEIVYSTLFFDSGEFLFVEGRVRPRSAVRLERTTRQLIAEGLRRLREHNRLVAFLPQEDEVLVRRQVDLPEELEAHQRDILELVDGRRSTAEIVSACGLGERTTLEALADLHRLGLVEPAESMVPSSSSMFNLAFERYRGLLQVIYMTLQAAEPELLERLESFLGAPPAPHGDLFEAVGFAPDGRLDLETLWRNARSKYEERQARRAALEALQSFYDYARFQALDVLDDHACDLMMNKLQEIDERAGSGEQES